MATTLDGALLNSGFLDLPRRAESEVRATALKAVRKRWRWQWERLWLLRWENRFRRPSWRIEAETKAWRKLRELVREYAAARNSSAPALRRFLKVREAA